MNGVKNGFSGNRYSHLSAPDQCTKNNTSISSNQTTVNSIDAIEQIKVELIRGDKVKALNEIVISATEKKKTTEVSTSVIKLDKKALERIPSIGAENDIVGARMMGGGFGGCVIALVQATKVEEIYNRINTAYQNKFGRNMGKYLMQIGDGTRLLD